MKLTIRLTVLLLISIAFLGCSDTTITGSLTRDRNPDWDIIVPNLGEDIELGYGQTVFILSENMEIEFSSVLVESRCPKGARCFWEGQADIELWLKKPDRNPVPAVPSISPGKDPDSNPHYSAFALGYKISLMILDPYPNVRVDVEPEDYIATLRIRKCPDPTDRRVHFTWAFPASLQIDPVSVISGTISGDMLTVKASHSGGCREHDFKLFMRPVFMESYPVQANLFLQHIDPDDPCDAIITEDVSFDIRPIAELYREGYGGYDDIILNVYGYFEDEPGEKIRVTYSPE